MDVFFLLIPSTQIRIMRIFFFFLSCFTRKKKKKQTKVGVDVCERFVLEGKKTIYRVHMWLCAKRKNNQLGSLKYMEQHFLPSRQKGGEETETKGEKPC